MFSKGRQYRIGQAIPHKRLCHAVSVSMDKAFAIPGLFFFLFKMKSIYKQEKSFVKHNNN